MLVSYPLFSHLLDKLSYFLYMVYFNRNRRKIYNKYSMVNIQVIKSQSMINAYFFFFFSLWDKNSLGAKAFLIHYQPEWECILED